MAKKGNITADFIKPIAVLTVICIIASASMATAERVTAPIIEETQRKIAESARLEVLPGAQDFQPVDLEGMPDGVAEVYKASNGTVTILTVKGYGGPIKIIVGIDNDQKIVKTKILSNSETQGLGAKIANESKNGKAVFQTQFEGKDKNLDGVDTIAGATISSNAFISGIKKAFDAASVANGGGMKESAVGVTEEKLKASFPNAQTFLTKDVDGTKVIYCGDEGYAIFTKAKGYAGELEVATLLDNNGVIADVIVESHTETESIGGALIEDGYTEGFAGKTNNDVDARAGATMTSAAIKKAVGQAIEFLETAKGAK